MNNQHQLIKGYRDLSPEEISLMNEGKELAVQIERFIDKLQAHPDTDKRWVAIGRTDAQIAMMTLTRSVAKPTTF